MEELSSETKAMMSVRECTSLCTISDDSSVPTRSGASAVERQFRRIRDIIRRILRRRATPLARCKYQIVSAIKSGDPYHLARALSTCPVPVETLQVVVKRRCLNPHFPAEVTCTTGCANRRGAAFVHFYQQCSPVIYAVDCNRWDLVSVMSHFGFDLNQPQACRRWEMYQNQSSSINFITPYFTFWTRGNCTYQSVLDYYFASAYEFLGEDIDRFRGSHKTPGPMSYFYANFPQLECQSIDVHRLDSIITFNVLAFSFDIHLRRFSNGVPPLTDIPTTEGGMAELLIMRRLVEHGFSQFECMEYLSPCYHWCGITMALCCHPLLPLLHTAASNATAPPDAMPAVIRAAALLLVNFLALRCTFPRREEFEDYRENLNLRMYYSLKYPAARSRLNHALACLQEMCYRFHREPMSLRLLARNAVRRQLGGVAFSRRVAALRLPLELRQFVLYLTPETLYASLQLPHPLVSLARGFLYKPLHDSAPEEYEC